MITFFRKIRQKLLSQNRVTQYLTYAIGEVALVMIGILLALQVNNWNESRKARRTEVKLLNEMSEELLETKTDLLSDMKKATWSLNFTDSIYQRILLEKRENRSQPLTIPLFYNYERSALYAKLSAYESLQAYGINIISNDLLRKEITDFYQLHLKRIGDIETLIGEINQKEFDPYLRKNALSIEGCNDCISLFEMVETRENYEKNAYLVLEPTDELMHLLKRKFGLYKALNGRYEEFEKHIDKLISTIERETE